MAFEIKEGTGSIFKNKKPRNDKSPQYFGTIKLDGKVIRMSLWLATTKSNEKYFMIKANWEHGSKNQPAPENTAKPQEDSASNGHIPF